MNISLTLRTLSIPTDRAFNIRLHPFTHSITQVINTPPDHITESVAPETSLIVRTATTTLATQTKTREESLAKPKDNLSEYGTLFLNALPSELHGVIFDLLDPEIIQNPKKIRIFCLLLNLIENSTHRKNSGSRLA